MPSKHGPSVDVNAPVDRPAGCVHVRYAVMGAGKSTLCLQVVSNLTRIGRRGFVTSCHDRGGAAVTSRLGVAVEAYEFDETSNLAVEAARRDAEFIAVDEAQFLRPEQVDQLADAADSLGLDVYAFCLLTDFRARLFPGAARLLELADVITRVDADLRCWCGAPATQNGRVVAGEVVHHGEQVLAGDLTADAPVSYVPLCRKHWRLRRLS